MTGNLTFKSVKKRCLEIKNSKKTLAVYALWTLEGDGLEPCPCGLNRLG